MGPFPFVPRLFARRARAAQRRRAGRRLRPFIFRVGAPPLRAGQKRRARGRRAPFCPFFTIFTPF